MVHFEFKTSAHAYLHKLKNSAEIYRIENKYFWESCVAVEKENVVELYMADPPLFSQAIHAPKLVAFELALKKFIHKPFVLASVCSSVAELYHKYMKEENENA